MSPPKSIASERILLVEGNDDDRVIASLLSHMYPAERPIQIIVSDGSSKFESLVDLLSKQASFRSLKTIGLVLDADLSAADAFQKASGVFRKVGLAPPVAAAQFSSGTPAVGIFVMPGDGAQGALETLCLRAIEDESVYPCIQKFVDCLGQLGLDIANLDKARVKAYLASLNGIRLVGEAANSGRLNLQHSAFDALRLFLQEMVTLER